MTECFICSACSTRAVNSASGRRQTPLRNRLRFLNLDGVGGTPGSLIWESPVQTFPYRPINFNSTILTITVPKITAPDHFAWTISNSFMGV